MVSLTSIYCLWFQSTFSQVEVLPVIPNQDIIVHLYILMCLHVSGYFHFTLESVNIISSALLKKTVYLGTECGVILCMDPYKMNHLSTLHLFQHPVTNLVSIQGAIQEDNPQPEEEALEFREKHGNAAFPLRNLQSNEAVLAGFGLDHVNVYSDSKTKPPSLSLPQIFQSGTLPELSYDQAKVPPKVAPSLFRWSLIVLDGTALMQSD